MKSTIKMLSLLLGLALCTPLFMSCGDDDKDETNVPNSSAFTANDLVGTWTIASQDITTTYVFTKNKLTVSYDNQVSHEGEYQLKDDILSYNTTYQNYNTTTGQYEQVETTVKVKIGLLYNKTVLIWKDVMQNDNNQDYEFSMLLFKQGANITATNNDIQGNWHWYMRGDVSYVRAGLKIEGNNFDLIITPWGQRYTGTYTYVNGYMILNTQNGYTTREEGSGDGWGEGDLNPETLEGNWNTLDRDRWTIWEKMPFVANGTEAYGIVANLPALFTKK